MFVARDATNRLYRDRLFRVEVCAVDDEMPNYNAIFEG
jgi:hypothetical protein